MDEHKMKFTKIGSAALPSVDTHAPVPEILDALNKHGITLMFVDEVFKKAKEEAEHSTVVFSPTAFWRCSTDYVNERKANNAPWMEASPEEKKTRKLEKIADKICEILAQEKVLASDVPMLCSCLVNKIYRLSVTGKTGKNE